MGFNRVAPPPPFSVKGMPGTGVKARVFVSKTTGNPSVYVTIQKRVWSQLEAASKHFKWQVLEGDGDDAGYLRMAPDGDGEFEPGRTKKGDALQFRLGELNCAPLHAHPAKWCGYTIQNGVIVVKLPSWAFPGSQKVTATAGAATVLGAGAGQSQARTVPLGEPTSDYRKRREQADAAAAKGEKQRPPMRR
jgi:hypothetical protein